MTNEELKAVMVDLGVWKTISRLIIDYPEMGYKSVDEFASNAIFEFLKYKGLELGKLQTFLKR